MSNDLQDAAGEDRTRKFVRLQTNLITKLKAHRLSKKATKRIDSKIKDMSTGGAFVECYRPFPIDTVLDFSFRLPEADHNINVKGIVRWVREKEKPRGMGIQFIQISTENNQAITSFLRAKYLQAAVEIITKTKLHEKFLMFFMQFQNSRVPLDTIAEKIGVTKPMLKGPLGDFQGLNLVSQEDEDGRYLLKPFEQKDLEFALVDVLEKEGIDVKQLKGIDAQQARAALEKEGKMFPGLDPLATATEEDAKENEDIQVDEDTIIG